tara:strand:+ start:1037 stop:1189 length:153 start_codon:yes stop_codon:yes gene_type:complete
MLSFQLPVHVSVSFIIAHPLKIIVAIKIDIAFIGFSFDKTPRQKGSYNDW